MKNIRSFLISCQKHVSINLVWEQLKVKKVSSMKKKQMEELIGLIGKKSVT